jgi:hypothetical protein
MGAVLRTFALATLVIVLGACGERSPSTAVDAPPSADADAGFFELLGGYGADYQPARTPGELASWSEVVVSGHIDDVQPGPTYPGYEGDPIPAETIVLRVAVEEVHAGRVPGADDHVYVQLFSPGGVDASAYRRHLPKDASTVLYLVHSREGEVGLVADATAGRPKGGVLMTPTTPQGFVLGYDNEAVQALEFERYEGASISEFLPESERFPYDPSLPHED